MSTGTTQRARRWAGLRSRAAAWLQPRLTLQAVGAQPDELRMLEQLLAAVGPQLGLRLQLRAEHGEVVVIEQRHALKMAPAAMDALVGARPLVVIGLDVPAMVGPQGAERLFESRQRQLLRQLAELPINRGK